MPPTQVETVGDDEEELSLSNLHVTAPALRKSHRDPPKFTGKANDFPMWKRQFEAYCMTNGCDEILFSNDSMYSTNTMQRLLYSNIIGAITNPNTYLIIQSVDMTQSMCGITAWKKLCDHFQGNDGKRIYTLFQELNKPQGSESTIDFLLVGINL